VRRYVVLRLHPGVDPAKIIRRRPRLIDYRILDGHTVMCGGQEPHRAACWGDLMRATLEILGEAKTPEGALVQYEKTKEEEVVEMASNAIPMKTQQAQEMGLMTTQPQGSLTLMTAKLQEMKGMMSIVQEFVKDVMVEGTDYGVIPGTGDKKTLMKPGAEKLNELYGFGIVVKDVTEEKDLGTGYYRARVVIRLVSKRTGEPIAEGVGEANTMEGRYRWRWVPEWELPRGIDKSALMSKKRSKGERAYTFYRMENDDPYALWNTVLKMAKKRGLVDATLSATRSSGLFTQDLEDGPKQKKDDKGGNAQGDFVVCEGCGKMKLTLAVAASGREKFGKAVCRACAEMIRSEQERKAASEDLELKKRIERQKAAQEDTTPEELKHDESPWDENDNNDGVENIAIEDIEF
jgi:hypothetical protein